MYILPQKKKSVLKKYFPYSATLISAICQQLAQDPGFVCHWHTCIEWYNTLLLLPPLKSRRSLEYFSILLAKLSQE